MGATDGGAIAVEIAQTVIAKRGGRTRSGSDLGDLVESVGCIAQILIGEAAIGIGGIGLGAAGQLPGGIVSEGEGLAGAVEEKPREDRRDSAS